MACAFVNNSNMAAAAAADELIKKINIYSLSKIDNPAHVKFFDVSGESIKISPYN